MESACGPRFQPHAPRSGGHWLPIGTRIAAQKYGGQVLHTGGAEFQERAARMCARLNIRVMNPDLAAIVRDARQQQPFDHRAWAVASQRVREGWEREGQGAAARERRAVEGRQEVATQEPQTTEWLSGKAGSATPQQPDAPIVQRSAASSGGQRVESTMAGRTRDRDGSDGGRPREQPSRRR